MSRRATAQRSLNRMYGLSEEDIVPPVSRIYHNQRYANRNPHVNDQSSSSSTSLQNESSQNIDSVSSSRRGSVTSEDSLENLRRIPLRKKCNLLEVPEATDRYSLDSRLAQMKASVIPDHESVRSEGNRPSSMHTVPHQVPRRSQPPDYYHALRTSPQNKSSSRESLLCESDNQSNIFMSDGPSFPMVVRGNESSSMQASNNSVCPTCGCRNNCGLQEDQVNSQRNQNPGDNSSTRTPRWWYFGELQNMRRNDPSSTDSGTQLWYFGPDPVPSTPEFFQQTDDADNVLNASASTTATSPQPTAQSRCSNELNIDYV